MDDKFQFSGVKNENDPKNVFGSSMRKKGGEFGGTPAEKMQPETGASSSGKKHAESEATFEYQTRNERVKHFSLNIPDGTLPDFSAEPHLNAKHGDDVFSYSSDSLSGKAEDYLELARSFIDEDASAADPYSEVSDSFDAPSDEKVEVERFDGTKSHNNDERQSAAKSSEKAASTVRSEAAKSAVSRTKVQSAGKRTASATGTKKKKGKKPFLGYSVASVMLGFACCLVYIFALTSAAATIAFSTINDILAINKSNEIVTVVVPDGASFSDVVNIVSDAGLIQQKAICTLFAKFRNFDKYEKKDGTVVTVEYLGGIYYVDKNIGFEAILNMMKSSSSSSAETVKLSFPEGWSAAQIFEKLEKNGVCEAEKLYANLNIVAGQYSFYADLPTTGSRYLRTEGYLYPDTYEFYVGENANSVLKKLYGNFVEKWIDDYEQRRQTMNYSLDQIITVASILQREAKDKEQMAIIASIIYNRLEAADKFPQIQCDSTLNYAQKYIVPYVDSYNAQLYLNAYNTYSTKGLPPGPICNPGDDAIYSALNPADTNYYYFCHDSEGVLYTAETYEEHMVNYSRVIG